MSTDLKKYFSVTKKSKTHTGNMEKHITYLKITYTANKKGIYSVVSFLHTCSWGKCMLIFMY